jgi:hypothetical protein
MMKNSPLSLYKKHLFYKYTKNMIVYFISCNFNEKTSYSSKIYTEVDADGDGYTSDEDCDDSNANIFPNQTEVCDGIDNNCNLQIDEDVQIAFFIDEDEDGFGSGDPILTCEQLPNTVNNNLDCDDQDANTYPFSEEVCDGIDNNCDEEIDEHLQITAYPDQDQDGFGNPERPQSVCHYSELHIANNTDCNDDNNLIYPEAIEICDELDNNCNNEIDEMVTTLYFQDQDEDGFGNPSVSQEACSVPVGFVENEDDCDDSSIETNPLSDEYCDDIDNDCDGIIDIWDVVDGETYYIDIDNDGYGSSDTTISSCYLPPGYAFNSDDCDDENSSIHPLVDEYCDGFDNDCDGEVDENDAVNTTFYYVDNDGDGFGANQISSCFSEPNYSFLTGDCDDSNVNINPAADEYCDDIDNNCNNIIDENTSVDAHLLYNDNDDDGYGNTISFYSCSTDNGVFVTGDCDDNNPQTNPLSNEYCDDIDNNCNNIIDDNPIDGVLMYADLDEDNYGDPSSPYHICEENIDESIGYVDNGLDCNDNDPFYYSDTIYYFDHDNDGFGDASIPHCVYNDMILADVDISSYVTVGGDCDDSNDTKYPDASELCSGEDSDCDGIPPLSCGSCLEIHNNHPDDTSGIYRIFETTIGSQDVYCDMVVAGGGWTLVQRTLWDWTQTQSLMTDYQTWFYESQNTPEEDVAWRLEGQFWDFVLIEGDHMFKHVARDLSGNDCDPLFYMEQGILMNIDNQSAEVLNASSSFTEGTTLQSTDSGSSCIDNSLAVPFFYGECCSVCPSYQGNYWSDSPHPMASYLDNTVDLYGNTTSEVCSGSFAITSDNFEGVNLMEYYLR